VSKSITHPHPINNAYLPTVVCRFLLVSLNIDAILAEVTIRQRGKKLKEMTQGNGLSEAYTATLTRVKAQKGYKSVLGLKALMWVVYSERPLRAEELCHALGVEIGSGDLDPENIPALRTVLASCLGLITIEGSFSRTVRLVHFTLQEYLSSNPTLFRSPHSAIAEVCLTYLNFGFVRDLSPTLRWAPSTTPFLEYASVHWGRHTRRGVTENIKILALRLLDRFEEHISVQLVCNYDWRIFPGFLWFGDAEGLTGFTGLHGVAYFGIEEMVSEVLNMRELDVNAADGTGNTALTWAATRGHDGVVKRLLERKDVIPDQPGTKYGRTPLSWAAGWGHEGIVKMLLERKDVNHNQTITKSGQTPLSWAADKGNEGIVKMLLERGDVIPDKPDTKYGRTPLSRAAENGHEGTSPPHVRSEHDLVSLATETQPHDPLVFAPHMRGTCIVKVLLKRGDVNPDQPDTYFGQTPLSWAAGEGHGGVVKILLGRSEVNPNRPDTFYGQTPLSWAAGNGHDRIVKMLMERKDDRSTMPDHVNQSHKRRRLSPNSMTKL